MDGRLGRAAIGVGFNKFGKFGNGLVELAGIIGNPGDIKAHIRSSGRFWEGRHVLLTRRAQSPAGPGQLIII